MSSPPAKLALPAPAAAQRRLRLGRAAALWPIAAVLVAGLFSACHNDRLRSAPPDVARMTALPEGMVDLHEVAPDFPVDLHYAHAENFVGTRIEGYEAPRAILSRAAAVALTQVHRSLKSHGLGLKLYDAYRPQQAVFHFVRWSRSPAVASPRFFAPGVTKEKLFADGYLALESAHSRGSAVDVSLVRRRADGTWEHVDLGSPVDYFGPSAAFDFPLLTEAQRHGRQVLRSNMERYGFVSYDREWWHFVLRDEPFAEPFDFPIR